MSGSTVFVVFGECGEYSDYSMWLVRVVASESRAEEIVGELRVATEKFAADLKSVPRGEGWIDAVCRLAKMHPDPVFAIGMEEAGYRFEEVTSDFLPVIGVEPDSWRDRAGGTEGLCSADALDAKDARIAELEAGVLAVSELISESRGVAGLHLNGDDEAPWGDLLEGGRYEAWLRDFSAAERLLVEVEP